MGTTFFDVTVGAEGDEEVNSVTNVKSFLPRPLFESGGRLSGLLETSSCRAKEGPQGGVKTPQQGGPVDELRNESPWYPPSCPPGVVPLARSLLLYQGRQNERTYRHHPDRST